MSETVESESTPGETESVHEQLLPALQWLDQLLTRSVKRAQAVYGAEAIKSLLQPLHGRQRVVTASRPLSPDADAKRRAGAFSGYAAHPSALSSFIFSTWALAQ
jgi:hypothetical protein